MTDKKSNRYQLTLKELELKDGSDADKSIVFEFENHDNILNLIEKVQQRKLFDKEDKNTQFLLGLKLFSEVMIEQRDNPLFEDFAPAFREFMKKLKAK